MRVLILGAGAVGGYFGGRLIEAGADVTFFVREKRARQIAEGGLEAKSALGDFRLNARTISDPRALEPFELVILGCKAYDLGDSLEEISGAVGPNTAILPLLNGLAHLHEVAARFPRARVWGGVAHISSTLRSDGVIEHFATTNRIVFGVRDGAPDARISALAALFSKTPVEARVSAQVDQDLWDKFVFLAALAGMTSLMRASIGAVLETPSGRSLILQLLGECQNVARLEGFSLTAEQVAISRNELTRAGSTLKSSMLRDIERGGRTEGEHILGDMFARARKARLDAPMLETALTHVRAYEIERARKSS